MNLLCDTSVLIAATSEDHVHHEDSFRILSAVQKGKVKGSVSAHSLAEFYSNVSAMPQPNSPAPASVLEILRQAVLPHFAVIVLGPADYMAALERVVAKNLKSGAIYDALIFQAAVKKRVMHLVTWNLKDFDRLSKGEVQIVAPKDLI